MFYGWYMVAAALLLTTYSSGVLGYGFTAFISPIAATFGWSYAQISLATSFRALEVGALDPLMGVAADRWPSRRLVLIGVIIYGLGILCISQATSLVVFYIGFMVLGFGGALATTMVPQVVIGRWFRRNIGKASSIRSLGVGLGGVLVPLLVLTIDSYGWQTTLVILGTGMWIVGIPLSFVFRTKPEEYGLVPDGKLQSDVKSRVDVGGRDFSTGAREALTMRAFWHIGITFMIQAGSRMAVMTHIMPYLSSLGIERSTASMLTMAVLLISLPARLGFGWLADIFPKKYILAISLFLTSIGLFLFWILDGSSFILMGAFAVTFGLSIGAIAPMHLSIVREYFGAAKLGTILGLIGIFSVIGLMVWAPVAGWVFDTIGVYDPVWLIMSGASMIGVITSSTSPTASKKLKPIS